MACAHSDHGPQVATADTKPVGIAPRAAAIGWHERAGDSRKLVLCQGVARGARAACPQHARAATDALPYQLTL